jgi:heat-inducible transcriptional repressor
VISVGLDQRKLQILKAIIDDYIASAEPVGSRTIAKKYAVGVSSATIRNEMSDLEEMGYLEQPHTSAGRIPSDKAYRLYVDKLMNLDMIPSAQAEAIKKVYDQRTAELEDIVMQTARVLCNMTNYTSVVIGPKMNKVLIKSIQLVPVDEHHALMVVVTSAGVMKDLLLDLPQGINRDYLGRVSNMFTDLFRNKTFAEVDLAFVPQIQKEIARKKEFFNNLIDTLSEGAAAREHKDVHLEGATNIFNFPEYYDVVKAKEFLRLIEDKGTLYNFLNGLDNVGVSVVIGGENSFEELKGYSVVTASYKLGDKVLGSIAIIGPTRMEYSRAVSTIGFVCKNLSDYLTKWFDK